MRTEPVSVVDPGLFAGKTARFVKSELKRANVTYEELARRLSKMGMHETKVSIASKLSRGAFSATFFLSVMKAIGRDTLTLQEVERTVN
jgi:hypothetical protein